MLLRQWRHGAALDVELAVGVVNMGMSGKRGLAHGVVFVVVLVVAGAAAGAAVALVLRAAWDGGKYREPVCPHAVTVSTLAARARRLTRICVAFNMVKL
jgi:hypothetical protein